MSTNQPDNETSGASEAVEILRYERCGITFEWQIHAVPADTDEGKAIRAAQARAIRNLLEWFRDTRQRPTYNYEDEENGRAEL